jgi:dTDP-4-amino-4,6-dideoxygalactose transaminase
MMGGGYADGVNSGTSAVFASVAATDPPPMSQIVVPPITDAGGVMPVTLCNAVPVVADSTPGSYNTDAEQIERVLTDRTHAIIVAHIGGIPADMDPILDLAEARGIWVIEDCAQAHYAFYKDRLVGSIGHLGAFSTMFGKQHATAGQGGVVYTRDEELHFKARRAADRGKPFGLTESRNVVASLNLNMDHLQAVVGKVQLERLPAMIEARRAVAGRLASRARGELSAFKFHEEREGDRASWWFVMFHLLEDKLSVDAQTIVEALQAEGISISLGYGAIPLEWPWATERCVACGAGAPCDRPECRFGKCEPPALPNARAADAQFLRFGIHEGWLPEHADQVIDAMVKVEAAYA